MLRFFRVANRAATSTVLQRPSPLKLCAGLVSRNPFSTATEPASASSTAKPVPSPVAEAAKTVVAPPPDHFAVFLLKGKQYKVVKDDLIVIERQNEWPIGFPF